MAESTFEVIDLTFDFYIYFYDFPSYILVFNWNIEKTINDKVQSEKIYMDEMFVGVLCDA